MIINRDKVGDIKKAKAPKKPSALQTQIGGSHYTDMVIQPIEYILANNIPFPEGNVIKYVSRWRAKGRTKDLEKAIHHLKLLLEHEGSNGAEVGRSFETPSDLFS